MSYTKYLKRFIDRLEAFSKTLIISKMQGQHPSVRDDLYIRNLSQDWIYIDILKSKNNDNFNERIIKISNLQERISEHRIAFDFSNCIFTDHPETHVDNKLVVKQLQKLLKSAGIEVKCTICYELLSRLSGEKAGILPNQRKLIFIKKF